MKSYFVFLRYLIYLNLLHCVFIGGFILGPTGFYGRGNGSGESVVMTNSSGSNTTIIWLKIILLCDFTETLSFEGNDSVLDFVLGSVSVFILLHVYYLFSIHVSYNPYSSSLLRRVF